MYFYKITKKNTKKNTEKYWVYPHFGGKNLLLIKTRYYWYCCQPCIPFQSQNVSGIWMKSALKWIICWSSRCGKSLAYSVIEHEAFAEGGAWGIYGERGERGWDKLMLRSYTDCLCLFWFLIFDFEIERDEMVGQIDASVLYRLFMFILIFDFEIERDKMGQIDASVLYDKVSV